MKILIVDDVPANLYSLSDILEGMSKEASGEAAIHVMQATSGDEALKLLLQSDVAPVLAILDVQMPIMDGYELAEAMRSHPRMRHIPIIFVSAIHREEQYIFRGYESGAVDFLTKPLDINILRSKVSVFLNLALYRINEAQKQADNLEIQAIQLEKQRAEIRETQVWFREIIESAPDAILVVDTQGMIVLCNKRADAIFGYAPGELLWKNIDSLVPLDIRENHPTMRHKFISEERVRETSEKMNLRAVRKDGSGFAIEVGLSKLPENDNKTFVCVSARDVTAKKEAEAILHQAKQIAEENTQMKSDFLANMSHEIRTPMNAIIGISHLIAKTQLTPKQHDYVRKIQSSSQHLLGIINDILDLSKIEAGKIMLEQIDFKVEKVLSNVMNLLADKAKEKQLDMVFDVDPTLPSHLNGDPLRLGQILVNYVNNAVKFTDEGNIVICVKVLEDNADDVLLHFSVRDTGIGLTQASIDKLFQDFQQASASTSRKYGGSGLGLSISKKLATLMKGEVGVESVLGEGSTFWFSATFKKAISTHLPLTPLKNIQGRRALIVDDNEIARYELENMLSNIGLAVTQVATGEKALKCITMADNLNEPYDLVFLDWYMPNMDGAETAKAITALSLAQRPHIVMVTAYGREEMLTEMAKSGLEEVLIKPVNISLLFDVVMRLLDDVSRVLPLEETSPAQELSDLTEIFAQLKTLRGANILVVEDNLLNQEVAMGLLCDEGFNVDMANDGREALYMLSQQTYDIVLMDMQMPVMDGVEATIDIRKQTKFDALPIIAMTANAMQQDKESCLEAGMNDYVSKPINPAELYSALLKWIPAKEMPANAPHIDAKEAVSELDLDSALPIIEGLDVHLGLSRVLDKKALYLSMLKKYIHNQWDTSASLREALAKQDYKTAERLAHSARSVNGNIGAMPLHDLAQEIEILIRTAAPLADIEGKLEHFARLQRALITALKANFTTTASASTHGDAVVDTSRAQAVLDNLVEFLTDDDTEALKVLDENSQLLTATLGSVLFEALHVAVNRFDFDHAIDLILNKN